MGKAMTIETQVTPDVSERLWSLLKDGRQIDCELRPCPDGGVAVHVLRAGKVCARHSFDARELAFVHADLLRRDLAANGWRSTKL